MELIEAKEIDTKEILRMAREWKLAVERGEDVGPIEKNITAWTIESVYGGEAAWQWKKEKDDARKVIEKQNKDAAEIERKARIKADVEEKEAATGKTIDEMAQIVAAYNKVQESLRQKEIGAELEKQKAAQIAAAPVVEFVSKNSKAAK